jgi:signal transduction histidine kinase
LIIRDEVYGAIVLYQHAAHTFSDAEIQLALAIGDYAALAVENARLFAAAHDTAALEERQRLARELHDSVSQALYVVKLYAEAAGRRVAAGDTTTAMAHLRELRSAAQEALQEMRLLIFELLPPILEQEGLASAIQARLDGVEGRAGLQTRLTVEGEHCPTAMVGQALYRIAQEALNNALKHAHAHQISVLLQQEPQSTLLMVVDDGIGFDPPAAAASGGLGFRGMKERVALLGGRLTVESTPGMGTVIRAEVGL